MKAQRQTLPRDIGVSERPEQDAFQRLRVVGKQLIDTTKMIAYRTATTFVCCAI